MGMLSEKQLVEVVSIAERTAPRWAIDSGVASAVAAAALTRAGAVHTGVWVEAKSTAHAFAPKRVRFVLPISPETQ